MVKTFKTAAILTSPVTLLVVGLGALTLVGIVLYGIGRWLYRELGTTRRRQPEPQQVVVPAPEPVIEQERVPRLEVLVEQAAQAVREQGTPAVCARTAAPGVERTRKPRVTPKPKPTKAKPSPAKARAKPKPVGKPVVRAKKPKK